MLMMHWLKRQSYVWVSMIDVVIVDIYDLTVVRQVSKNSLAKDAEPTG